MPKLPKRGHKVKPTSKDIRERIGKDNPEPKLSRRQKAKLKCEALEKEERQGTVISNVKANPDSPIRGRGDSGLLLTDPTRHAEDIKLVETSIQKGWNVRRKGMLKRRLEDIAMKTTGDMNTKDGIVESETVADKLAIDAIKVLVAMDTQDIARVKNSKPQTNTNTVVNVTNNVVNSTTNRFDARTIELARLANKFGAREFTVDGKPIPIAEIIGATSSVSISENGSDDSGETTADASS